MIVSLLSALASSTSRYTTLHCDFSGWVGLITLRKSYIYSWLGCVVFMTMEYVHVEVFSESIPGTYLICS